jgi:DNA-binding MarR family transcriptional regulator
MQTDSTESPESRIRGCTSAKVRQLMRTLAQHYDAEVAHSGIKTTQYSLLSRVAELGPLRPVDLAEAMRMTASTLSRNLQPLVAAGWLDVVPGEDARSHLVSITATGLAQRDDARRYWRIAQSRLNARVGAERVLALHRQIDEMLALMGDPASDGDDCLAPPAGSQIAASSKAVGAVKAARASKTGTSAAGARPP